MSDPGKDEASEGGPFSWLGQGDAYSIPNPSQSLRMLVRRYGLHSTSLHHDDFALLDWSKEITFRVNKFNVRYDTFVYGWHNNSGNAAPWKNDTCTVTTL